MFEQIRAEAKDLFSTKWGASSIIFIVAAVVMGFMIMQGKDLVEKEFFVTGALICLCFSVVMNLAHNIHKLKIEHEIKTETDKKTEVLVVEQMNMMNTLKSELDNREIIIKELLAKKRKKEVL